MRSEHGRPSTARSDGDSPTRPGRDPHTRRSSVVGHPTARGWKSGRDYQHNHDHSAVRCVRRILPHDSVRGRNREL